MNLVTQPCAYTGRLPSQRYTYKHHEAFIYNGLDRLDPNLGYTVDNCVPCCFEVNRAKSDMLHRDFMQLIHDIAKFCPNGLREFSLDVGSGILETGDTQ